MLGHVIDVLTTERAWGPGTLGVYFERIAGMSFNVIYWMTCLERLGTQITNATALPDELRPIPSLFKRASSPKYDLLTQHCNQSIKPFWSLSSIEKLWVTIHVDL